MKPDGEFDNGVLAKFVEDVKGIVIICDGPARFFYGSIPKFIVYVMNQFV